MVYFFGVDVQEGRLKEAPEERGNTQNCGECPHGYLLNLTPKPAHSYVCQCASARGVCDTKVMDCGFSPVGPFFLKYVIL